jgi:hypothetical protein
LTRHAYSIAGTQIDTQKNWHKPFKQRDLASICYKKSHDDSQNSALKMVKKWSHQHNKVHTKMANSKSVPNGVPKFFGFPQTAPDKYGLKKPRLAGLSAEFRMRPDLRGRGLISRCRSG